MDYYGRQAEGLRHKKLWLLDMDGTVYLGDRLFEGTNPFLQTVLDSGGRFVFLTNNSSKSVRTYLEKAERIGMLAREEDFFTSAQAAAVYLKSNHPGELVYIQGTRSFAEGLTEAGIPITEEADPAASVVLVGFDTELTYEKLTRTCEMLRRDVTYLATNPDWVCPVENGYVPDCGSMCFGLEKATGKSPLVIGKPQPMMVELMLRKYGIAPEEAVLVGDRLYTDIRSGFNAGIDTVLVFSGEATEEELKACDISPTYVFRDISELRRELLGN